ncbi:MAG: CDP-alcohol phosphatidyltransferase family protein, partial [Wenzhouxiangellaceae bacterium]
MKSAGSTVSIDSLPKPSTSTCESKPAYHSGLIPGELAKLLPLTFPTILTLLRIVMIPVLMVAFYLPQDWSNELAVGIFIAAGLTDWADGWT